MRPHPPLRQTIHAGAGGAKPAQGKAITGSRTLAGLAVAGVAVVLSACAGGATVGTQPVTTAPAAAVPTAAPETPAPGPAEGAAATDAMKQTVTDALERLAAGAPKPATDQVTDALTGSGIVPGVLEVSQSRTPTGLAADSIEAAVLQGGDCVIGQVREGTVTVTVLPVLASGKCFAGS